MQEKRVPTKGLALYAKLVVMKDSFDNIFKNKNRILAVFSHPDDAEIYAGGTIARLINAGKEVGVVKMTLGNKGSRQEKVTEKELADIRLMEDKAAMKILGIKDKNNIYLDFSDGAVETSINSIEKLVRVLRKFKPDIVITHNPEDVIIRWDKDVNWINHRDHRNTGKLVVDASYPYSRDILFFPHHLSDEGLESHIVSEFLLVDYYDHPDTIAIDITDYSDIRTDAIAAHASQYAEGKAQASTDFFTKLNDSDRRYERFRYVIAD